MLLSVVFPRQTPDKTGIWVAVGVILNPFSIQRAHGAVVIPGVFRFVVAIADVNLTAHAKKHKRQSSLTRGAFPNDPFFLVLPIVWCVEIVCYVVKKTPNECARIERKRGSFEITHNAIWGPHDLKKQNVFLFFSAHLFLFLTRCDFAEISVVFLVRLFALLLTSMNKQPNGDEKSQKILTIH